jgi:hypothetical protein
MNNLSWSSENSAAKKSQAKKEEVKKKKIDYKKEIDDLEKIHKRILEKYELHAHNKVSNSMIDIKGAIENLKKFEQ